MANDYDGIIDLRGIRPTREETTNDILKKILFQLHVISSQNYTAMAHSGDPYLEMNGGSGLQAEQMWLEANRIKPEGD